MTTDSTRGGVSIRWSLFRSFLLLILVLAPAILLLLRRAAAEQARILAEEVVHRGVDRMESDLAFFFEPVADTLRVAQGWATTGVIRCGDPACINPLFAPILRRHDQIDSVGTGDAEGRGVRLAATEGGWRNRIVHADAWGRRARMVELTPDLVEISSREEDVGYDPRTRPWYRIATAGGPDRVHWTDPYLFFSRNEPGITASVAVQTAAGQQFVVSLDVRLDTITDFVRRLDAGKHGLVFVTSADGRILGLPKHPSFESEASRRKATLGYIRDLQLPVLQAASAAAARQGFEGPLAFPFGFEGETWWGAVRLFRHRGAPELLLGVVAPEQDFLPDFSALRLQLALLSLAAVALAALVAGWLARRYSRAVGDLVLKSDRIRGLDLEPQPPTVTNVRELRTLDAAQEDMRKALDSFARYVPTDVVRDLLQRGEAAEIGGREQVLSVLFTDIVGFTAIAEGLSPQALTRHMSEYFDMMVNALREHHATIDKFVGDAIVAFWGAPTEDPSHAAHALDAVLVCQERLAALNDAWTREGKPALPTRFGLATGPVVVGNVGARTRLHYTVLGDMVNLASRLEGANGVYGTRSLVAESTVLAGGDGFVFRPIDRLAVKGRTGVVTVYELLGRADEVGVDDPRRADFERALTLYQARHFDEALTLVEATSDGDPAAARLAERCREAIADPPPADWDGATRLTRK